MSPFPFLSILTYPLNLRKSQNRHLSLFADGWKLPIESLRNSLMFSCSTRQTLIPITQQSAQPDLQATSFEYRVRTFVTWRSIFCSNCLYTVLPIRFSIVLEVPYNFIPLKISLTATAQIIYLFHFFYPSITIMGKRIANKSQIIPVVNIVIFNFVHRFLF